MGDIKIGWKQFVGVVLMILAWGALVYNSHHLPDTSRAGTFGDAFAPLTAFFSAIAMLAALSSFNLQRKDNEEQRKSGETQATMLTNAVNKLQAQADASAALLSIVETANKLQLWRDLSRLQQRVDILDINGAMAIGARLPGVKRERRMVLPGRAHGSIGVWLAFCDALADGDSNARSTFWEAIADRVDDLYSWANERNACVALMAATHDAAKEWGIAGPPVSTKACPDDVESDG